MENEVILRRAVFGGFDRKQVMEYISYLHSKSNSVKSDLEELDNLRATVAELEAEIVEKDNMIDKLNVEIQEAENGTRLGRASATLMKESVAYADCYIESAKVLAHDISERTNERVEDAKGKIEGIMDYLGDISDSILGLYSSMDSLKEEYDCFGDIYPEAELNVDYPDFNIPVSDTLSEENQEKEVSAVIEVEPSVEDPFPSDADMTEFLRSMETKYRELLNN